MRRKIEPVVIKISCASAVVITLVLAVLINNTMGFSVWYRAIFEVLGIFLIVAHVLSMILDIIDDMVHFSAKFKK